MFQNTKFYIRAKELQVYHKLFYRTINTNQWIIVATNNISKIMVCNNKTLNKKPKEIKFQPLFQIKTHIIQIRNFFIIKIIKYKTK